jgi:hypothetical protein
MFGFCGLDCEQCGAFIATKNNDDDLRKKVAEEWAKQFNAPITPEHINCTGCSSTGIKTYYCGQLCEIRKCASPKSIGTCAECDDYPCDVLNAMLSAVPGLKEKLNALRAE